MDGKNSPILIYLKYILPSSLQLLVGVPPLTQPPPYGRTAPDFDFHIGEDMELTMGTDRGGVKLEYPTYIHVFFFVWPGPPHFFQL